MTTLAVLAQAADAVSFAVMVSLLGMGSELTRTPVRFGTMSVAGKRRTEYDATAPRMGLATRVAALSLEGKLQ